MFLFYFPFGDIAQLGERLNGIQEVSGSIPLISTLIYKEIFIVLSMTKLRDNSKIILILLLFFFIVSMVVGGLVGGANIMDIFIKSKNTELHVGYINDSQISRQFFTNRISQQSDQNNDSRRYNQLLTRTWDQLVSDHIDNQALEDLEIHTSSEEVIEYLMSSPPPSFQQGIVGLGFFADSSGAFDSDAYINAIINENMPIEIESYHRNWENYLKTWLSKRKLRNFHNSTNYVTNNDIKQKYIKDSLDCNIDYVYINYSNLADSLVYIDDESIQRKYNEEKESKYKKDDYRIVEYVYWENDIKDKDSLDYFTKQQDLSDNAKDFLADVDISSFEEALKNHDLTSDTIQVTETFTQNSGIPYKIGFNRRLVRFAFDNSLKTISDDIETENGVVVMHILDEAKNQYKDLSEVENQVKSSILKDLKKKYAENILSKLDENWDPNNKDDLLKFEKNQTNKIKGPFPGINTSSEITGTILALESGQTSVVGSDSRNSFIIRVNSKDEVDLEQFKTHLEKSKLENYKRSSQNPYTSWIRSERKTTENEFYGNEIY